MMKRTYLLATAIALAIPALPATAHHNCAAGDACPDEIGDMLGNHAAVFEDGSLDTTAEPMGTATMTDPAGATQFDVSPDMDPADAAQNSNPPVIRNGQQF
jgi:hypothetical protein